MPATYITDADLESRVLQSPRPVFIDFYADWCQPCRTIAPIIDELADVYAGRVDVLKLNVDENPMTAQAFRVQSLPTMAVVKDGRIVAIERGALPRPQIEALIAKVAGPPPSDQARKLEVKDAAGLIQQRRLLPVDVRSEAEFNRAHLPGAVNAPEDQREAVLAELAERSTPVLFYGRTTEAAEGIAKDAAKAGLLAAWLDGGLLAWEADGLPIERGTPAWMN